MNTDPWLIQLLRDVIENDLGVAFFTPQSFSITFISVISFNVWWGPKSRPEGAEMLDFISFWFPFWMLLVDILEVTVCLEWFSVWLWGLVVGGVSLIALGEDFWAAQRWAFFGHVLRSDLGGWCGWVMDAHIGEGGPPPAWVDFSGSFYCGLPHFTVIGLDLEPQFYSLSLLWVCFSWFLFRFGFHCASKTMNYRVPCPRICLFSFSLSLFF